MAKRGTSSGSIRIGPITIISFVIVLSMAVLAVLALTTAHANSRQAARQEAAIATTYELDSQGQRFLAELDAALAGADDRDSALASLQETYGDTLAIDGDRIDATFTADGGRKLSAGVEMGDDLTYRVVQWTTTTDWTVETHDRLWTGN